MKPRLKSVEEAFLTAVCGKISDDNINKRLEYLFEWYSRKAQFNKCCYNWTRLFSYLVPCLITLISVYAGVFQCAGNCIIGIIASLSAILVVLHHIVDHFRFYESWIRYRTTAEKLKREAELFLNGCDPYNDNDQLKNKKLFAQIIECATEAEISSWEILRDESFKPFKNENQETLQSGGGNLNANLPVTPTAAP